MAAACPPRKASVFGKRAGRASSDGPSRHGWGPIAQRDERLRKVAADLRTEFRARAVRRRAGDLDAADDAAALVVEYHNDVFIITHAREYRAVMDELGVERRPSPARAGRDAGGDVPTASPPPTSPGCRTSGR
jgi:hypothetical protein